MYSDRVNTIDIYKVIETDTAVTPKRYTNIGPAKKPTENHLPELSIQGRKRSGTRHPNALTPMTIPDALTGSGNTMACV